MAWNSDFLKMFVIVFVIGFMVVQVSAVELPSFINVCGRRDPNIDQCLLDNMLSVRELCRTGVPELQIPSLQPLYLDTMTFFDSSRINVILTNTYINGMCDYKINYFHLELEKNHFDIDVTFDRLEINGTYHFDMRVLVPIAATGTMFITTENVAAKVRMDFKTVNKNHKTYGYASAIQLKLNVKGYDITYGKVESKTSVSELHQILHGLIGDNKEEILKSITPYLEKAISKEILRTANDMVKNYTYDQILPDKE